VQSFKGQMIFLVSTIRNTLAFTISASTATPKGRVLKAISYQYDRHLLIGNALTLLLGGQD